MTTVGLEHRVAAGCVEPLMGKDSVAAAAAAAVAAGQHQCHTAYCHQ